MAVVGAGWSGLAAAVHACRRGHAVQLFEMAPQAGGRARSVRIGAHTLDNGQHILIGAYQATLELMAIVSADAASLLQRRPLVLQYPDGQGPASRAARFRPSSVPLRRHGCRGAIACRC